MHALEHDFAAGSQEPPDQLLRAIPSNGEIELEAPPTVAANFGSVNGAPHIFLANFTGLVPSKVAVPTAVNGIRVRIHATRGEGLTFLPFLGEAQVVHGEKKGDNVEFVLPALERGAIVWVGARN